MTKKKAEILIITLCTTRFLSAIYFFKKIRKCRAASTLSSSRLNMKCYSCQQEDVFWEEWFSNYLCFYKTCSYEKKKNPLNFENENQTPLTFS